MRWTRLLLFFIVLCLGGCFWWWFAPAIQPVLAHPPKSGALGSILLNVSSPAFRQQRPLTLTNPAVWVFLAIPAAMLLVMNLDTRLQKQTAFGSASAASRRHARRYRVSRGMPKLLRAPLTLALGAIWKLDTTRINAHLHRGRRESCFIAGTYHGRLIGINEHDQEEHVLLVGPTGSRKSTLEIIGNLLRERGHRSLFVPDLKGELYRTTVGFLAQHHQIWRFAPRHSTTSQGYNPFAFVNDAVDATLLAETWIYNTGVSRTDQFWTNFAQNFLSAVILHIRKTEPLAPFSRLRDYIVLRTYEDLKDTLSHSPSRTAREKMQQFLNNVGKNERLVGSTMSDIGVRFQLFDIEAFRQVTALNEIDFNTMVDDPTVLFLSIPRSERRLYRPLMATLAMQMFRAWEQRAEETGMLPRGIACYMDEFANIGYIPNFDDFITTTRSMRVALILVIQSFSQLDNVYGKEVAETIRSNTNTNLLFPGAGLPECRYYSERIGDTTVRTWSRTSRGSGGLFGVADMAYTEGQTRRRLYTPEELRTLAPNNVLMLPNALPPMILKVKPYYQDRSVRHLADLPYHVTPIHQQPPPAPALALGQPPSDPTQPPIIVDADQDNSHDASQAPPPDDVSQHFLDEDE